MDFAVQQIDTRAIPTLQGLIADLNGDGKQEVLVPKPLTPYLGADNPQAEWISVYVWNGVLLVDASPQFATYYLKDARKLCRSFSLFKKQWFTSTI